MKPAKILMRRRLVAKCPLLPALGFVQAGRDKLTLGGLLRFIKGVVQHLRVVAQNRLQTHWKKMKATATTKRQPGIGIG